MVEKVRKGKVKYYPVSDYSRPKDVGVNARIEFEPDEFVTVKEAYGLLKPGRWTKAIVAWMQAQGVPTVGYLDDFFMVADAREEVEEHMMLLVEFVSIVPSMVWGLSLYTRRRGFAFLAATTERLRVRLPHGLLEDLAVLEQVVQRYNGRQGVLYRREVHERHFAIDASGTLGFGELWEDLFFLLSWADLARMPQRPGHDIRLQPRYISSEDSVLADSRLELDRFRAEHRVFMRATIWRQNQDDWSSGRAKSYCYLSWSREEDARVQLFDGHNDWGNLPFSIMLAIIKNFLQCKRRQQMGTACCFLMPAWDGHEAWELVQSLPQVFRVVRWPVCEGDELVEELQQETERCQRKSLAPNSRRAYGTGLRAFVTFCISFACLGCLSPLLPATNRTLALFITFSSWFVQPDTIKSYLAGFIALGDLGQLSLWAAILVGFFGLFRKDNLTTGKQGAWNTRGALVRDVLFCGDVIWLRVRHSKTIQCGERCHWVPLGAVPGSLLCPVQAVRLLMDRTPDLPGNSPLFVVEKVTGRKASVVPVTHDALVAGIKSLAGRAGLDPERYAGHLLRRCGATAARRMDVNTLYIKMQGDWKSDCFERYCDLGTEQKLVLPGAMAAAAAAILR
eukprot:gene1922-biopygen1799